MTRRHAIISVLLFGGLLFILGGLTMHVSAVTAAAPANAPTFTLTLTSQGTAPPANTATGTLTPPTLTNTTTPPTPTSSPTLTPTGTSTPTRALPTNTPTPTPTSTSMPMPVPPTNTPTPTSTGTSTPTPVPPTNTPTPTATSTSTPTPGTPLPISTPVELMEWIRSHPALFIGVAVGLIFLLVILVLLLLRKPPKPKTTVTEPQPPPTPKPMTVTMCPNCGARNRAEATFCKQCGAKLAGQTVVAEPPPAVVTAPSSRTTSPLPRTTTPISPPASLTALPKGALVGGGHYSVLDVIHQSKLINRYLAQGQQVILRCPKPDCGAENTNGAQYCEKCGASLAGVMAYSPRYWIKEAASVDPLRTEYALAGPLSHANVIPPREAFEEQSGGATRYYVVLDEPIWQTVEQTSVPQELPLVLGWGIGLAEGLTSLHGQRIALQELADRQVALVGKVAQWTDFATAHMSSPEEWQNTGTQHIANDVRQLAALLYRLATGLKQYDPNVKLMSAKANAVFAQALGIGYTTADELAAALREVEAGVRHPGGIDVHAARLSDVGQQRDLDEDSILTLELGQIYRSVSFPLGVYAVADGMGGHEGGDVASRLAIRTIARRAVSEVLLPALTDDAPPVDYESWLKSVVQEANQAVYDRRKASRNDMGTTLVMAVVIGATTYIAHVGDSRAYRISQGTIKPLTQDHSLVERLVATGQIKPEEAATHPQRNVIYKSIGDKPRLEPDINRFTLVPGDVLLLCCDGLNTEVSDTDILRIVTESLSLPEATRRLVRAANDAGGGDNISVVLVGIQAVG